jgi:UDP-N-acetylglucosamine--N-acetylmuramyl-(pentapeptide) pyrophosphoryl-undecaprenol N-acetylglucosamine transferase
MDMSAKPRLLIAASGTGGHIFPALAVAQELKEFDITWLGVPGRLEENLIPGHYPLVKVTMQGLQRKTPLAVWQTLSKLVTSTIQVRKLLQQDFKGVFTTGSYIAAPALLAAKSLGLPALLHESNALPGKVTRFLAQLSDGVGLGFSESATYLHQTPTRWLGTPVREEFFSPQPLRKLTLDPEASVLVVMGGSQGAKGINRLVLACAPAWFARGIEMVHLTGAAAFEACQGALQHPQYHPLPFCQEMGALLYRADVVLSRAGAMSLAEITATGCPSILVPFPYAADDHQTVNAQTLVERGAALLFQEASLSPEVLTRTVLALFDEPGTRQSMSVAARALSRPKAAEAMADWIRETVR